MTTLHCPIINDTVVDALAAIAPELLDQRCLNHGFVKVLDCMPRLIPATATGCDFVLADAARISYQKGTRKVNADAALVDHLIRNQHCYPGDSEVLTSTGWYRWQDLPAIAEFVVPDPTTGRSSFERLAVNVFDVPDQDLVVFRNGTTSFRVTDEHRVWFREKVQRIGHGIKSGSFGAYRANACPKWGWFQSAASCPRHSAVGHVSEFGQFAGFYLGDGCHASKNTVSFHLKKGRKKQYLIGVLNKLGFQYKETPSKTHSDAVVFSVSVPDHFWQSVSPHVRSDEKSVTANFLNALVHDAEMCRGVLDGLRNSDGSRSKTREQWSYSSKSEGLINLYETLNALLGIDCRRRTTQGGVLGTTACLGAPIDVESRKGYWSTERYSGKTYCTTTSTGLLITRGCPSDCAILNGNTSPIEMAELKFHCRMPILTARQWIRHRTASVNEESARYSELASDFYIPSPDTWAAQIATDKQATSQQKLDLKVADVLHRWIQEHNETAYKLYQDLLAGEGEDSFGFAIPPIAREQARMVLGVNIYTQWVWKIDLKNLLHFLRLRTDPHAQYEIRVFADAMARVVEALFPAAWASFRDNFIDGVNFSARELQIINSDAQTSAGLITIWGWSKSRFAEFRKKCEKAGFKVQDSLILKHT